MDHYARAYPVFSRIRGYGRYVDMLHSLRRFSRSEIGRQRLKIIEFYERYGEKATKEAFGADRKVIHVWKKRLRLGEGHLSALVPSSTRPRRTRRMTTDPKVLEFIRGLRQEYPRIGKEKIKYLLSPYCAEQGIPSPAESTIGKIIKRNKLFFQKTGKVYHNPDKPQNHPIKRLRINRAPRHQDFGNFQIDSSHLCAAGLKRYFISAIDSKLKFAFSGIYSHLSSRAATDFLKRLETVCPLPVKTIQSDNGSEFLGEFDSYLKNRKIPHYFSYPRCPKINGCVERFNRTLKEEFLSNNLDIIIDIDLFRIKLANYLVFYNTRRPHKSLGLKSPLDYLFQKGAMSNMYRTYTPI